MFKRIATVVLALVAPLFAVRADAGSSIDGWRADFDSKGTWGVISISASPTVRFEIWGEQADSSYSLLATGSLGGAGSLRLTVPQNGSPTDGLAQYYITLSGKDRSEVFAISDPSEEWWLE